MRVLINRPAAWTVQARSRPTARHEPSWQRDRPDSVHGIPQARRQVHQEGTALATATATKLRPLGDRVVIQPTPREEMTKSGIVLPDTAKEKPQEGTHHRGRPRPPQ